MAPLPRLCSSFAPAVLLLLYGCTTEPSAQLLGTWESAAEGLDPAGWHQTRLTFGPNGMFASDVRSYGVYGGQGDNDLSSYSRIEGDYEVEGNQLIFHSRRLILWDRFHGPNAQEQVEEPYSITLFDDAHYTIQGDHLHLQYLSYPADAPIETSREFLRVD